MLKSTVVVGGMTDHGGIIQEGDDSYTIDGKAAHLEGMTHYCPKCKVVATAESIGYAQTINGRKAILIGDRTSCGAIFVKENQSLQMVERVSSSINSLHLSNFLSEAKCFDEQFILKTDEDELLTNTPYTIKFPDGTLKHGTSDSNGFTERVNTEESQELEIYIGHV